MSEIDLDEEEFEPNWKKIVAELENYQEKLDGKKILVKDLQFWAAEMNMLIKTMIIEINQAFNDLARRVGLPIDHDIPEKEIKRLYI